MLMHKTVTAIALSGLILIASCSSAVAWFGQTSHDWSFAIPVVDIRFGIVEWQTGTTTVFLGIFDFRLACGAYGAAGILAVFGIVIVGAFALFLSRRRRHERIA
jgi:hypothetical protein